MKFYTVDDVIRLGPWEECTKRKIAESFAGREALTPNEIAALEILPIDFRIWLLSELLWKTSKDEWFDVNNAINEYKLGMLTAALEVTP